VPLSTPALESVTPLGSAPLSLNVGAGEPVAVTVNDPAIPTTNVVLLALVMAGAWLTATTGWTAMFVSVPPLPDLDFVVKVFAPPMFGATTVA